MLLTDADLAAGSNDITKDETETVLESPIVSQSDSKVASAGNQPQAIDADQRFLGIRFENLHKPEEFAAWGAAQARANNIEAAVRALREAIGRSPDNVRYLRMLADVRLRQNNPQAAVKVLSEARAKSPHDEVSLLKKELLASLYLPQPDSFTHALAIAESLLRKSPEAAKNPMVQIWRAAALGQKYSWLKRNNGSIDDIGRTREAALHAVQNVVRLTPNDSHEREILQHIFDPVAGRNTGDNDLSVFYGDPDFMSLIPEPSSASSP